MLRMPPENPSDQSQAPTFEPHVEKDRSTSEKELFLRSGTPSRWTGVSARPS